MDIKRLDELEVNTVVRYGAFKCLLYKGKDDSHVTLEDRSGYQKRFYIDLFLKHGKILNIVGVDD